VEEPAEPDERREEVGGDRVGAGGGHGEQEQELRSPVTTASPDRVRGRATELRKRAAGRRTTRGAEGEAATDAGGYHTGADDEGGRYSTDTGQAAERGVDAVVAHSVGGAWAEALRYTEVAESRDEGRAARERGGPPGSRMKARGLGGVETEAKLSGEALGGLPRRTELQGDGAAALSPSNPVVDVAASAHGRLSGDDVGTPAVRKQRQDKDGQRTAGGDPTKGHEGTAYRFA
jgi:hypothetical protein